MADIELVIKIPEEVKEVFDNANIADVDCYVDDYDLLLGKAIKNCIPLPKGHGRLKDIGKCNRKLFYKQCGGANSLITVKTAFDMLLSLPTIIEADKES